MIKQPIDMALICVAISRSLYRCSYQDGEARISAITVMIVQRGHGVMFDGDRVPGTVTVLQQTIRGTVIQCFGQLNDMLFVLLVF